MKRALFLMLLWLSSALQASQLPTGFVEQLLAQNLDPTDFVMTPDGRIFITIKSGKIVIVENGVLSATALLDIPVYNYNEAGLCHMVLDPNFEINHYYYVYYTVQAATHNRVSRFTANGNSTVPGSEVVILDLDAGTLHNGGDMAFGIDGKLYIAVGEGDNTSKAQSFGSLLGKVLRINADGTVPTDNPFFNNASVIGRNKAIFALGFRNPFSMDIQPGTGRIFLSDAGAEIAEEIDEVLAGKNYGWPHIEGMRTNQVAPANYQDPFYAYLHGFTAFTGCAVVAAAFYNPTVNQFPSQYVGQFFYADYCNNYINYIDPITGIARTFATQINGPVGVLIAPDGTLYYLARAPQGGSAEDNTSTNNGTLWKVTYTGSGAPVISAQPQDKLAIEGDDVNFITSASGTQPLTYQWRVNNTPITGATQASYTFTNAQLTDDGKKFSCRVSNSLGSATTQDATLSVITNTRPVPQLTVTLPANATLYQAGQSLSFSGSANDNEDGDLPPSALTWKIDFHHEEHIHPGLQPTSGITSGSFSISRLGETSDEVWYRVILTATDSKGLSASIYQDIFPQKTKIILNTTPPNLILNLDGQPTQTPDTVISVVGKTRTLEAPATETVSGKSYLFSNWTPSGLDRLFTFNAPATETSYKATYTTVSIQPQNPSVVEGYDVDFSIVASTAQTLSYQWLVNGATISGATQASYTFPNAKLTDSGKKFSCMVSNSFGSITAQEVTLSVIANMPPVPQLIVSLPANAVLYQAGQAISFSGSATDNEDGVLPPSSLTWKIDFHHALHLHAAMQPISGITSGSFNIPRVGETSDDVWYRVILTAADSKGLSNSVYKDVFPQKVKLILNTNPPNLLLNLDGQPTQTPYTETSVVGITRTLEAPATVTLSGKPYLFSNWTPSGLARSFTFNAPVAETSYSATYTAISIQPQNPMAVVGDNVNFSIVASGAQPFSYQWRVNGAPITGATLASYTFLNAKLTDNGKKFSCTVSNSFGSVTAQESTLSVIANTKPVPQLTVTLPANGVLYQAGQMISFSGSATDNEDGVLPPTALTWKIDFHHTLHIHPALESTSGITSGSFNIPRLGENSTDVWYRIILTATDSKGLSNSVYKDVFPQKVKVILNTNPPNLILNLDGQPIQTPDTMTSVVGMTMTLEAPEAGSHAGKFYVFSNWTQYGLDRLFTFNAPLAETSYTAIYRTIPQGDGLMGFYFNTMNKTNTELHSFEGNISLRRIDTQIDFDWSDGSPNATFIDDDFFTVRWIGEVLPMFSETYTFYLTGDDGVRLWVNDVPLIDQWIPHDSTEWSASISLIAGKKYPIKIEFFEEAGCAVARLKWKSQQVPKQTVPQIHLFASTVTEIKKLLNGKMASLFPSPADMEITLQLFAPSQKENGYMVSDLMGRKLLQGNLAANQKEWRVDISTLPPGYFIFKTSQLVLPFIKK